MPTTFIESSSFDFAIRISFASICACKGIAYKLSLFIMSSSSFESMTGAVSTAAAAAANIRVLVRVRPFNERELRFNPTNILDIGGSSANADFGSDAATNNNNNNNNNGTISGHGTTVAIVDQSSGGGYGSGYDSGSGQQLQQSARSFQYDAVFGPQSTQKQIFETSLDIVDAVCAGYNGTIVAYGQTGSGKTHTVFGTEGE